MAPSFAGLDKACEAELARLARDPRRKMSRWFGVCAPAQVKGLPCLAMVVGYWATLSEVEGRRSRALVLQAMLFDDLGRVGLGLANKVIGPVLDGDPVPSARKAKGELLRSAKAARLGSDCLSTYAAVRERWAVEEAAGSAGSKGAAARL